MKLKTFLMAALTATCCTIAPQRAAAQIKFIDYKTTSYEEVLRKAQAEKKNIYVDIWTPWCGVCKMMDRWVFPRKDVGDYFNTHFVNLSFDAENPRWVEVARNFNATAFPTMLILNPQGEVIMNIDNLGVPQPSDTTSAKSEVGGRLMYQAGMAERLIAMPDSAFLGKSTVEALCDLSPAFDTKVFARMAGLKNAFLKRYPNEFNRMVDDALGTAAVNMVSKSGHKINAHKAAQYRAVVNALDMPSRKSQLLLLDLNIALATGKWDSAVALAKANAAEMNPDLYATLLDGLSDCKDKATLRAAVKLCEVPVNALPGTGRMNKYVKDAFESLKAASH